MVFTQPASLYPGLSAPASPTLLFQQPSYTFAHISPPIWTCSAHASPQVSHLYPARPGGRHRVTPTLRPWPAAPRHRGTAAAAPTTSFTAQLICQLQPYRRAVRPVFGQLLQSDQGLNRSRQDQKSVSSSVMEELGRLVPRSVARQATHQGATSTPASSSRLGRPGKSTVLECRVCEDPFELHGDKIPRLLFCGHTLCHACLVRLPTQDGFISCPFDRQQTLLGSNGVWELNKNFALMEMIERIQLHDSSAHFSTQFLERERELAVACDEVEEHVAVVYCTVCGTHLCESCSDLTHATRTLAKHRRIPLSEKPREKPVCGYHTSHVMEFTCLEESCASEPLMCYICKDYGRHKGHNHNLLELEAEQTRARMASAVQKMKKFMEEMGETTRKLEQVTVLSNYLYLTVSFQIFCKWFTFDLIEEHFAGVGGTSRFRGQRGG